MKNYVRQSATNSPYLSRITTTGGGGGGGGEWNTLTPADLQTDAQSYSTFTLSASPEAGYENRIEIANNVAGVFNEFRRAEVGVLYFDTGFTLNELGNADNNNAVFQIFWEPYNMQAGSSYQTNIGYPLGVCLFSSLTPPPFAAAPKAGFFGHGFLHTLSGANLRIQDARVSRMRNQTVAGIRAPNAFDYLANQRFQALLHTITVCKSNLSGSNSMVISQGDFNFWYEDTTINEDVLMVPIGQQQDIGQTTDAADTVILGVMFNLFIDVGNGGVIPSPTQTWDFNLKWRRLFV